MKPPGSRWICHIRHMTDRISGDTMQVMPAPYSEPQEVSACRARRDISVFSLIQLVDPLIFGSIRLIRVRTTRRIYRAHHANPCSYGISILIISAGHSHLFSNHSHVFGSSIQALPYCFSSFTQHKIHYRTLRNGARIPLKTHLISPSTPLIRIHSISFFLRLPHRYSNPAIIIRLPCFTSGHKAFSERNLCMPCVLLRKEVLLLTQDPDWEHWLTGLKQMGLGHVTVTEASEKLGLAPRAGYLTRLCRKGKIPEAYLSSGVWLIPVHWVLSEGQKKGVFSPRIKSISHALSTDKPETTGNPGDKASLANINLLLLEIEELVKEMEKTSSSPE